MAGGTWTPSDSDLGTVNELVSFDHDITYEEEVMGVPTTFTVTITPQQTDPTTISISNGDPANISGYYFDSFDNSLRYLKSNGTYEILEKFEDIDEDALSEMIYYLADRTFEIVFSYVATANGETKTYTKTVQNDWTPGKNTLQQYVQDTIDASSS